MAVITYKCPNCGGDLQFDPDSQQYRCEYCRSKFNQKQLEELAGDDDAARAKEPGANDGNPEAAAGAVLYNCPNCGAEIVTDESTTATFCYYCHNPVVLAGKMQGEYHPDHVLPFAIDKTEALRIFEQWIGKKKYIPKAFYSKDQIEKMVGVYFPYWLYSCEVDGRLEAEAEKRKIWTTGNIQYTETQKFDVTREGQMQVDHVPRNALSKANRKLAEGVLPFEMEKLKPFHMGYLSGFMAEKRDLGEESLRPELQREVEDFAVDTMLSEVGGYDSVMVRHKEMELKDEKWSYALLPVWTLTYRDPKSDTIYYFACNGQTGKVCGELPVDNGRLMLLFASLFVPVFIALLIVGYFL